MASRLIRKAKVSALAGDAPAAADEAGACDHCGDSLAGLRVVKRPIGPTLRSFCCNGCSFIAEQLYLAEAGSRDRATLNAALAGEAGGVSTEIMAMAGSRVQLEIRGMVCSACALLIEHQLRRLPGVAQANVDFGAQVAYVAFDPRRVTRSDLQQTIERAGYDAGRIPRDETRSKRVELLRVLIAWLGMMQVMMLAVPLYFAEPGDIPADIEQLMRIASLVLTLPVVLFSAQPLYRAAWSQLKMRAIGMDLPVVVGIGAAFIASAVATVTARGATYFDSVTMFIALVLASRWLLARGLAAAREHIDAARRQPMAALRLVAFPSSLATESIAYEKLKLGDRVLVPPGETVPADGVVVHGRSSCSQAWLTGESTPIDKSAGAPVLAGSINLDQPLVVEVTRIGESTSLAALQRMVDEAGRERPRIVEMANRVAVGFLWAVLAIGVATLAGWWLVDPAQALPNTIAVLVATCPCALSLAAPAAIAAAQSALAERRVLLARTAAIESLAQIDLLACDKTGTMTTGEPSLLRQLLLRDTDPEQVLAIAASMETLSTHPYSRALISAAQSLQKSLPPIVDGRVEASAGIEATVGGRRYRLGKTEFTLVEKLAAHRGTIAAIVAREALGATSYIVLADPQGPIALFVFGERLRDDAATMVDAFIEKGVDAVLLSGDRREPVHAVAAALGIEQALAHQTPESKRNWVADQQRAGHRVAMLGDGMNDAPVIAQADVSIALASGSTLAQARADLIVLSSRLADVQYAFAVARRAMKIVRQNLAWAFAYNVVIIPLAAFGHVSPAVAAAGMAASSLLVIANALRARRLPARTRH
jgi:Cu2+-exporting ATPase